jgi:hypothetical protein
LYRSLNVELGDIVEAEKLIVVVAALVFVVAQVDVALFVAAH